MPNALPKRSKAEGKSLPEGAPTERGSRVQRDALRQAKLLDGLSQREKQRLCGEIGAHLTVEQDRGSFIDDTPGFSDMLLFAGGRERIVRDRADIRGNRSASIALGPGAAVPLEEEV